MMLTRFSLPSISLASGLTQTRFKFSANVLGRNFCHLPNLIPQNRLVLVTAQLSGEVAELVMLELGVIWRCHLRF